jgi:transposase InsO family protein
VDWLAQQRICVARVMTDNCSAFISRQFTTLCRSLVIRHVRMRPIRANTKAERFIQTLLREWAYRFSYTGSDERQRWLDS